MDQSQARKILRGTFPNRTKEIEEYITEAEHQDGSEYWTRIAKTSERLTHDFQLYLDALDIKTGEIDA